MDTPGTILTGERTVPGVPHENYWFRRHEAAYAAVPGWVPRPPSLVLDAGCGEGYAASILHAAWPQARVVGLDYDAAATAHAAHAHAGPGTAYLRGALTALPLGDAVVGLTTSLQVLEHIWTPQEYARELARVTRPDGLIVVSTPNRLTFSPGLGRREPPANAYHCREYDAAELGSELRRWFPGRAVSLAGLHHGDRLRAWQERHGSLVAAQLAAPAQDWPVPLAEVVVSVTARDFELGTADDACLDLVAVVGAPS